MKLGHGTNLKNRIVQSIETAIGAIWIGGTLAFFTLLIVLLVALLFKCLLFVIG